MSHAVDLFGGAGGASWGLHLAGYRSVAFDWWDVAVNTHNANGLPALAWDLSDESLDKRLLELIGKPDILWGSPPCQPWSAAGNQEGADDDRDGLPWFLRIVGKVLAPVVIMENVKGLTFDKNLPYLEQACTDLRAMGYEVAWNVLNCADYGIPQTRERLFVIARRDGGAPTWPTVTHTENEGLFTERWVSMADALGWDANDLVGFPRRADTPSNRTTGVIELDGTEYRERDLFPAGEPSQTVTEKGRSWSRWKLQPGSWADGSGGNRRLYDPETEPSPSVVLGNDQAGWEWVLNTGRDWKPGGTREDAQTIPVDQPAPAVATINSQWWWTRPATTIAGDPRVFSPGGHVANDGRNNDEMVGRSEGAIRVSIPELAALQGFPPEWIWTGTRTDIARQIGNAVPPHMARVLAEANRPKGT